jgi:hypothetical protein
LAESTEETQLSALLHQLEVAAGGILTEAREETVALEAPEEVALELAEIHLVALVQQAATLAAAVDEQLLASILIGLPVEVVELGLSAQPEMQLTPVLEATVVRVVRLLVMG